MLVPAEPRLQTDGDELHHLEVDMATKPRNPAQHIEDASVRQVTTMLVPPWAGLAVYYLAYAIHYGLPRPVAEQIVAITLAAVTVSTVLHGISVRPMMRLYGR